MKMRHQQLDTGRGIDRCNQRSVPTTPPDSVVNTRRPDAQLFGGTATTRRLGAELFFA
jgi:hypothetical protein